jgi:hypothetical protein
MASTPAIVVSVVSPAVSTAIAVSIAVSGSRIVSVPVTVSTAPVVASAVVAAVVPRTVVVVPGSNADKDPAGEVVRTVIAIGSAGIRIIRIVAIRAVGRWPKIVVIGITRPDLNAYRNLRGSSRCYQKQSPQ